MENTKLYDGIISRENLIAAFFRFRAGKRNKQDVLDFTVNLGREIEALHLELKSRTYRHGPYHHFVINDPKRRDIHKASVRDRVLHHALYAALYPHFDRKFIFDSYSCRKNKGSHRAVYRFASFVGKCSRDYQKNIYVLKCDIRKFFASIDHDILMEILKKHIACEDTLRVLQEIVDSFETAGRPRKGLPLGNLTSQLLVNVYMNEFDQFVKHVLKSKFYIRYADDFVFLSDDMAKLERMVPKISAFLAQKLALETHPQKVFIRKIGAGVDFLGWVNFEHHRVVRASTKRRMLKNISQNPKPEVLASYRGLLSHGNSYLLSATIMS